VWGWRGQGERRRRRERRGRGERGRERLCVGRGGSALVRARELAAAERASGFARLLGCSPAPNGSLSGCSLMVRLANVLGRKGAVDLTTGAPVLLPGASPVGPGFPFWVIARFPLAGSRPGSITVAVGAGDDIRAREGRLWVL